MTATISKEQSLTLYHYWHCPFCVRVRMILAFWRIPYKSQVLSYDDAATPVQMCGTKMLPIMFFPEKTPVYRQESKDIIAELATLPVTKKTNEIENNLEKESETFYRFFMPFWSETAEFSPAAKKYFEEKKGAKRGPFLELRKKRPEIFQELLVILEVFWDKYGAHLISLVQDRQKLHAEEVWIGAQLWGFYFCRDWLDEHQAEWNGKKFFTEILLFLQLLQEKTHVQVFMAPEKNL